MMNMKNMTNSRKRNLATFSLIIFIAVSGPWCIFLFQSDYTLKIIKCESGWGYSISNDQGILIYQDNMPAYEGIQAFPSKEAAKKTGKLVMKKLHKGKLPIISRNELDYILK